MSHTRIDVMISAYASLSLSLALSRFFYLSWLCVIGDCHVILFFMRFYALSIVRVNVRCPLS